MFCSMLMRRRAVCIRSRQWPPRPSVTLSHLGRSRRPLGARLRRGRLAAHQQFRTGGRVMRRGRRNRGRRSQSYATATPRRSPAASSGPADGGVYPLYHIPYRNRLFCMFASFFRFDACTSTCALLLRIGAEVYKAKARKRCGYH